MRSLRAYYLTQGFERTLALIPVKRVIFSGETKFQRIEVLDFDGMGRGLVLDGFVQAVESDEFIYHETLIQTAFYNCGRPKQVAIIGGGDGGALREVLRCRSVQSVVMVDIDETVVDISKKYLRCIHRGSFYDKRARVIIRDGREFLKHKRAKFDAIIVDATDPVPSGPSLFLYSLEFYKIAKRALKPGGVLVTQAAPYDENQFLRVLRTLKGAFRRTLPFHAYVKSFTDDWGFALGTDQMDTATSSPGEIDAWISSQIRRKNRYLSGTTYAANVSASPLALERLRRRVRPITDREARMKAGMLDSMTPWVYQ